MQSGDIVKEPETMLVFDLDGVVTDPETGRVNKAVILHIAQELEQGLPVAFVTGRAFEWVEAQILASLNEACSTQAMSRLLIVAEKSGVKAFEKDGQMKVDVDDELAPPEAFKRDARALLNKDQDGWRLGDTMFWDEAKLTMVSIERKPSVALADFHERRAVLIKELHALIAEHNLIDFHVDATITATDVEHTGAGKHKGAQAVLGWLDRQGVKPRSFVVFGDSKSDKNMAQSFGQQAKTIFVFVGDPAGFQLTGEEPYTTVVTGGGYSSDVSQYLATLPASQ